MLPEQRRRNILDILKTEGTVSVSNLAARLSTSVDTIRRDLRELEALDQLARVHGGALPRSPAHIPYETRQTQNVSAKKALAKQAAQLLKPNQVIIFDGGSTTLEVAKCLPPDWRGTIITVCPHILIALRHYPNVKAIMLSGTLNKASMTVIGSSTTAALEKIHADVCVLGICSLHPNAGVTAHNPEEAHAKALMIQNSAQVIAVTASNKLGSVAPFVAAKIEAITHIVTDDLISDDQALLYSATTIQLMKVSMEPTKSS